MIQTRSEINGLYEYHNADEAFKAAEEDLSIWKISFSLPNGGRVRLVRCLVEDGTLSQWRYESISVERKNEH